MTVLAARAGGGVEQRLDGEVGLSPRQHRCRPVANDGIGKERDQSGASPGCGPPQGRKGTLSDLLVVGASGFDQGLDRCRMLFGKLRERAESALLPQHREGRPGVADLLGRPLATGLKNVHRGNCLVMV